MLHERYLKMKLDYWHYKKLPLICQASLILKSKYSMKLKVKLMFQSRGFFNDNQTPVALVIYQFCAQIAHFQLHLDRFNHICWFPNCITNQYVSGEFWNVMFSANLQNYMINVELHGGLSFMTCALQ